MFAATKLVELVLQPGNFIVLLFATGTALCWTKYFRVGRIIATIAAAIAVAILLMPVDQWLAHPIESSAVPTGNPAHVDGIVILGGNMANLVEGATVAHRYPNATVTYTGGSVYLFGEDGAADYAAHTLYGLGVSRRRVVIERQSQTTYENLLFSKHLLSPKKGQVWLLVTSAIHMPRALAVARRLDWQMTPWPSENIADASNQVYWLFSFVKAAYNLGSVLHEYEALVAYRLEDKTDRMFP
jgi:uncharacterized SAM-binding protein YcdF (DUF218 family)